MTNAVTLASMGNGPAFSAYRNTTTQPFSQTTFTKVQFNAEVFDTNNCFDSSTNYRFTPNVAGYYQTTAGVGIGAGAAFTRAIISIYKNGTEYWRVDFNMTTGSIPYQTPQNNCLIYCNGSTDYLEVYVYSNAASPFVDNGTAPYVVMFSSSLVRGA